MVSAIDSVSIAPCCYCSVRDWASAPTSMCLGIAAISNPAGSSPGLVMVYRTGTLADDTNPPCAISTLACSHRTIPRPFDSACTPCARKPVAIDSPTSPPSRTGTPASGPCKCRCHPGAELADTTSKMEQRGNEETEETRTPTRVLTGICSPVFSEIQI